MAKLPWAMWVLFLSFAGGVGALPAQKGDKINSPDEVVHFFAVGDWGPQPSVVGKIRQLQEGSMHVDCLNSRDEPWCKKKSPEWDRDEDAQKNVMEEMLSLAKEKPIKWMINAGGNFHFSGIQETRRWSGWSVDVTPWNSTYDQVYADSVFQVPWFSVLGTSDFGGECCAMDLFGGAGASKWFYAEGHTHVMEQIKYDTEKDWEWPGEKESRWVMPSFNWSKVVDLGPYKALVVGIDTNFAGAFEQCNGCGGCRNQGGNDEVVKRGCLAGDASAELGGQCMCFFSKLFSEQLDFLAGELATAARDKDIKWRFVVAHHPWNFIPAGPSEERFLTLLRDYQVQVVFSGHVHSMRHDVLPGNVNMVMTGSSGGYQFEAGSGPLGDQPGSTVWSSTEREYGFAHVEMSRESLTVSYINDRGDLRETVTIHANPQYYYKPEPWGICSDFCGWGSRSRTLKCMREGSESQEDMSVCEDYNLVKLPTEESCYPEGGPALKFCDSCQRQYDKCDTCTPGFVADDAGTCKNTGVVATLVAMASAPPGSGLQHSLGEMLSGFVRSILADKLPELSLHVYVTSIAPEEHVAESRRLDNSHYDLRAVVEAGDDITAANFKDGLKLMQQSPLLPLHKDDVEITTVRLDKVLCAGLEDCSVDPGGGSSDSGDGGHSGHGGDGGNSDGGDGGDGGHGGDGGKDEKGGGLPWWGWAVIIVGLLVVAGGAGAHFFRRRRARLQLPVANHNGDGNVQNVQLGDMGAPRGRHA